MTNREIRVVGMLACLACLFVALAITIDVAACYLPSDVIQQHKPIARAGA